MVSCMHILFHECFQRQTRKCSGVLPYQPLLRHSVAQADFQEQTGTEPRWICKERIALTCEALIKMLFLLRRQAGGQGWSPTTIPAAAGIVCDEVLVITRCVVFINILTNLGGNNLYKYINIGCSRQIIFWKSFIVNTSVYYL